MGPDGACQLQRVRALIIMSCTTRTPSSTRTSSLSKEVALASAASAAATSSLALACAARSTEKRGRCISASPQKGGRDGLGSLTRLKRRCRDASWRAHAALLPLHARHVGTHAVQAQSTVRKSERAAAGRSQEKRTSTRRAEMLQGGSTAYGACRCSSTLLLGRHLPSPRPPRAEASWRRARRASGLVRVGVTRTRRRCAK